MIMMTSWTPEGVWSERLGVLRARHLERKMRLLDGPAGPEMSTSDGVKIGFCSNDYLGLADDPVLKQAAMSAVTRWGTGAGASRLVSGNQSPHEALERESAALVGAEAAVLFASGYQANVGALSALTTADDAIFSDQLVHASLIDGARLSRAAVHVFRHGDMAHLETLLDTTEVPGIKLVVTDAVFSMDGDLARLDDIVQLAERHGALVYLDEAHSLGIMGPGGRGLAAALGLSDRIAVTLGTFSKAFGVSGAFVAAGRDAVALLKSTARSLLYSTAPPAALAETISASLGRAREADDLRAALRDNIDIFRSLAADRGLELSPSETPIQPIITGTEARTMAVSEALWQRGFFVQGIRPPTVPPGTCRLRVTLSAKHTRQHIAGLVNALAEVLEEDGR